MRLVCVFALLLTLVAATSSTDSNDSKDVDSDLKRIRIDPALRKALLRALRHLKERQEEESDVLNTTEENFATTILDEILEESTSSQDRSPNVKYYSAETETDNGENEIIKTIIITKPKTTLTPPKEDYARDAVPDPIKERENELVDSNQVARSVVSGSANALGESKDEKAADDKKISVVTAASGSSTTAEVTPTVTTVTPTTTTTKGPTHNSDGENIEKVKSEDVKIYQAPLVAAFTVQQDQLGVPRNIPPPPQPQFNLELPRNSPAVQFIPSVSLPGKAIPISVEQQLPFKEPVNFQPNNQAKPNTVVEQVKSISPPAQQFPIIPPSPPQLSKQQLLPLKPFQPFNVNPAPAPLPLQAPLPIDQQLPGLQRTRVFRHETGTGNFGFSQALPHQQSNAPFRPSQPIPLFQQNNGFTPLRNDNQLQNLLVQSGITSRSAEDFNIITKVLALNHGIPQSSSQQMFAKLSPEQQLLFRKK
ncbi:hypothetical protein pipiens_014913 [Culex pipiens pipiens]|uniref:Uncharacterized protein n=1 Tax=Culex pipiens pipiens TaxID=38569 RepID=A0ABD1CSQ2_CULPP